VRARPGAGAAVAVSVALGASCGSTPIAPSMAVTRAGAGLPPLLASLDLPPAPRDEPDGEDLGRPTLGPGLAALATTPHLRWQRIDPPAGAHAITCDLVEFRGGLVVASAAQPIELDGARLLRYQPDAGWTTLLDWDRGGAAGVTHEVGGQGITRVRVIGDRLWATDADAPAYGGFGLTSARFEDYVFVSDAGGQFAPLTVGDQPPAGTRLVPWAFHALDVIGYRGAIVVSGGSVDLERRGGTSFPGALFAGPLAGGELTPRCFPGAGAAVGVVRTTSMVRFRGRLYAGLQNNERRLRWDLAVWTGDPLDPATPPAVVARVSAEGGLVTRRFAIDAGAPDRPARALYWIAGRPGPAGRGGGGVWRSDDGKRFTPVPLPPGAGAPQDLVIVDGVHWLLTRAGLYRAHPGQAWRQVAAAPAGDPFGRGDTFCSAPLVAGLDGLWAGSTRDGALYRVVAAPAPTGR
jgi:hypothetical protein